MNENTLNVKFDGLTSSDLRCYYCGRTVSLVELNKVDADLDAMSEEYGEGVVENLPVSRNQKIEPFIHRLRIFDQWFKVIKREGEFVVNVLAEAFLQAVVKKEAEMNEGKAPENKKVLLDEKFKKRMEKLKMWRGDEKGIEHLVSDLMANRASPHRVIMTARQANRPGGYRELPPADNPDKKVSGKKKPPKHPKQP